MEAVLTLSEYEIERNKPLPSKNHSFIQLNLGSELRAKYKNKYRFASELSLELNYWGSVPDISIFPKMPLDTHHDQIKVTDVPLGVIEILSPTQSTTELTTKAEEYFKHGVKSVWIIIPNLEIIAVYFSAFEYDLFRLKKDKTVIDNVLDIEISLDEIFE